MLDEAEVNKRLRESFGLAFRTSKPNDKEISVSVKSGNDWLRLAQLNPNRVSTYTEAIDIISGTFVAILQNAIRLDGYNVADDRMFLFGSSTSSTWKKRLNGTKALNLTALFDVDLRSSPDGRFNVVVYTPRVKHSRIDHVYVCYQLVSDKVLIEDLIDSPVYTGLYDLNMEKDEIKLVITEKTTPGVEVNGKTGQISVKSGVSKFSLTEIFVKQNNSKELLLYEAVVHNSTSVTIKITFYEHHIKVDEESNLVLHDRTEIDDPGVFPWIADVDSLMDFEMNPVTAKSSFAHLLADDEPLHISDSLWISSKKNVYCKFGTVWTPLHDELSNAHSLRKYMLPEHMQEIERYNLAMKLSNK